LPQWLIVVLQKYLRHPTDAASQQYQKKWVLKKPAAAALTVAIVSDVPLKNSL